MYQTYTVTIVVEYTGDGRTTGTDVESVLTKAIETNTEFETKSVVAEVVTRD